MRYRFAATLILACSMSSAFAMENRIHNVWYPTPMQTISPELLAQNFLKAKASELGVPTSSLRLLKSQESLLAYHLIYQQYAHDLPISDATISVSILKKDQAVYQYYSTLIPAAKPVLPKQKISLEQALDAAWAYVGVQGRLFQAPKSQLRFISVKGALTQVYSIDLSPTAPYGAWRIDVEAASGNVIGVKDLRINEKALILPTTFGSKVATSNRSEAFRAWSNPLEDKQAVGEIKCGKAKVFDPDPKTEMGNTTITDTSPASDFDAAYVQRILPEVSVAGGVYRLEGPWARIIDFDPPTAVPTTSRDGNWNYVRGKGGFTDSMTYFHLDQSQRYIQSLGFKDATGIQFGPIEFDADGANGDDNSYFMPSTNRLAFGHGCVDDNEDSDVILHEYGHAINNSINVNWGGGDMGAMGEGFGDYWAASYSYSTPKGHDFQPEVVYNWDAGSCWPGRILNALGARYNANESYDAHTPIDGGFQSDELWSTPLFQAHIALRAMDIPRDEIDTIVLESQFGLGGSLTMRDMAQSIVATAARLYPDGPHATVFRQKFVDQGILVEPKSILTAQLEAVDDADGVVDPGEHPRFPLKISNIGDKLAEDVSVDVTSDDPLLSDIMVDVNADFVLGKLEAGKFKYLSLSFAVSESAPCGHGVDLKITLTSKDGKTVVVPVKVQIGKPIETVASSTPNLAIPDKGSIKDKLLVDYSNAKVSANFSVDMKINHSYIGDLNVTLVSPEGQEIVLHDRTGNSGNDISGNYPTTLTPKEPLSKLLNQQLDGAWTLKVADLAASDTGTLISWGIRDVSGYLCH